MKEIIHIAVLVMLSMMLGALFLRIEEMDAELKKEIPNQVHALLDNSIRESVRLWFKEQEEKWNVFTIPIK